MLPGDAEHGEPRSEHDPQAFATMPLALIDGLRAQRLFGRGLVRVESAIRASLDSAVPALAGTAATPQRRAAGTGM
ncbi:hypothetical protein ABZU75_34105 [Streptosporangium sp. NPDC005286]|uniref:hypothetical protein n=1 Tax=Streptosporangium sp. NPDC005286 TaxID=3154463 RepID=UPI0033AD6266